MYYVAYNPSLGNALVGVCGNQFQQVPDGVIVEAKEGNLPDFSKEVWSEGSLTFVTDYSKLNRYLSPTEFMRRFSQAERLTIRQLERDGDLVIKDAMELMNGTKDGVNLDDEDVYSTLSYLVSIGVISQDRVKEIIS